MIAFALAVVLTLIGMVMNNLDVADKLERLEARVRKLENSK